MQSTFSEVEDEIHINDSAEGVIDDVGGLNVEPVVVDESGVIKEQYNIIYVNSLLNLAQSERDAYNEVDTRCPRSVQHLHER